MCEILYILNSFVYQPIASDLKSGDKLILDLMCVKGIVWRSSRLFACCVLGQGT